MSTNCTEHSHRRFTMPSDTQSVEGVDGSSATQRRRETRAVGLLLLALTVVLITASNFLASVRRSIKLLVKQALKACCLVDICQPDLLEAVFSHLCQLCSLRRCALAKSAVWAVEAAWMAITVEDTVVGTIPAGCCNRIPSRLSQWGP